MPENQNPEQKARDNIDALLRQAGWSVQHNKKIDLNAGLGQAVREYQTDVGPADYVLFVDKKAVGVIEAKKEDVGHHITTVESQTEGYASARLKWVNNQRPLPFLYESTVIITRFTDARDPKPRSREVFNFHRPETLKEWLAQGTSLRERLQHIPNLNPNRLPARELRLRDCQEIAITSIYRLLKHAHGKRALFLVDTKNLGEQAEQEMMSYVPLDDSAALAQRSDAAQHTVLYIEDNPSNLRLVAQILGRRQHIRLLTAHTPELGIELALARRPELILLDINMPGMDGYQVLEVFKADAGLKRIPVVAVTANAMPRDIERGK
ncbi:MAG: response regulator, partial [Sulfuricella sp.]|nr:response regulator [Sulfuricella sp.]